MAIVPSTHGVYSAGGLAGCVQVPSPVVKSHPPEQFQTQLPVPPGQATVVVVVLVVVVVVLVVVVVVLTHPQLVGWYVPNGAV